MRILLAIIITLYTLPAMAQKVTVGKVLERTIKDKKESSALKIIESWRQYIDSHGKARESTADMWINRDTTKFLASFKHMTKF